MRKLTAVVLGLLLVAACSSTEKKSAQTTTQDSSSQTATGAKQRSSGSVSAGGGASTVGGGAPAGGPGSVAPDAQAAAEARRPLVKAAPILLGVTFNSGNPGAAFGIDAGGADDQTVINEIKAITAEINAHGGMGGHKVNLAIRPIDQTDQSQATQSRLQNEVCTSLTEDAKVFAVVSMVDNGNLAYACYAKHGTPVAPYFPLSDDVDLRSVQPWVLPAMWPTSTRVAQFYPDSLAALGYMTKKIGVLSIDEPGTRRVVENLLIPRINALGGKVIDKEYLPGTYQGHAQGTAAAVLRFHQENIDRVVIFSANGGWFLFTKQAEQQAYRPRYAVTSFETPEGYIELAGARIPPQQLHGAVGASFDPASDVTEKVYPDTANEKHCWGIMNKRAGTNIKRRADGFDANAMCDVFFMLRDALAKNAGKPLARADMSRLAHSIGQWRLATPVPYYRFNSRLDGNAVYRRMAYNDACDCFQYKSAWLDVK
jgi:hypothetical protein